MKSNLKYCLVAIAILFISKSYSQKLFKAGANFTTEVSTNGKLVAGVGGVFEGKLKNHGGFETGIYYRTYKDDFTVVGGGNYYSTTIAERHISFPVLYKYYSRVLNFSVGPTFDFYLGWAQKNKNTNVFITSYSMSPTFNLGAMAKLSKAINVTNKFSLEPELRFNPIFSANRVYLGLGIAGKFRL